MFIQYLFLPLQLFHILLNILIKFNVLILTRMKSYCLQRGVELDLNFRLFSYFILFYHLLLNFYYKKLKVIFQKPYVLNELLLFYFLKYQNLFCEYIHRYQRFNCSFKIKIYFLKIQHLMDQIQIQKFIHLAN